MRFLGGEFAEGDRVRPNRGPRLLATVVTAMPDINRYWVKFDGHELPDGFPYKASELDRAIDRDKILSLNHSTKAMSTRNRHGRH